MSGALLAVGVGWILRLAITFANQKVGHRLVRAQLHYWISVPAILILGLALGSSEMLLRARLYLSAHALIHALPAANDDSRWIGLFYVREFSQFGQEFRFITNECGLVDQFSRLRDRRRS